MHMLSNFCHCCLKILVLIYQSEPSRKNCIQNLIVDHNLCVFVERVLCGYYPLHVCVCVQHAFLTPIPYLLLLE
jgi:hypothetical protein